MIRAVRMGYFQGADLPKNDDVNVCTECGIPLSRFATSGLCRAHSVHKFATLRNSAKNGNILAQCIVEAKVQLRGTSHPTNEDVLGLAQKIWRGRFEDYIDALSK